MTITVAPSRNEYTANAGQTIFNYTFKIYKNTDLNVYVTSSGSEPSESDLTESYITTGVGSSTGGTIQLLTPTSEGDLVTISSAIPISRETDYQNNGDFRPNTVNDDIDRVVSIVKQQQSDISRTLKAPEYAQNGEGLTLSVPSSKKVLRWREDLTGLENFDAEAEFINSSGDTMSAPLKGPNSSSSNDYMPTLQITETIDNRISSAPNFDPNALVDYGLVTQAIDDELDYGSI